MSASHDPTDRLDRARLVECCGALEGRAKQGDTIRVDGTSPRGREQEDVKESKQRVLQSAARSRTRPSR